MLTVCFYLSRVLFSRNGIAARPDSFYDYNKGEMYQPPFQNNSNDYKANKELIEANRDQFLSSPTRFQRISERYDRTDFPDKGNKCISKGNYLFRYRGFEVWKSPVDLVLYHELFEMVQPRTIIELGTLTGGTAIWMADRMKLLQIDCNIFSMDFDLSNLSEVAKRVKPDNVSFLQGDSFAIENAFTPEFLAKLKHPWVFIEDAHVNLNGVLCYFHQHLLEGDYIVVEDTNPGIVKEDGIGTVGNSHVKKLDCLRHFLEEYEDYYAIDSFVTDMFGYNGTWHWHGFIRKMK